MCACACAELFSNAISGNRQFCVQSEKYVKKGAETRCNSPVIRPLGQGMSM